MEGAQTSGRQGGTKREEEGTVNRGAVEANPNQDAGAFDSQKRWWSTHR